MSPGINNQPRSTGTLPKSNRNTTQPRISTNQESNWPRPLRTGCLTSERTNNLLPLRWQPISDREAARVVIKNSNKRPKDTFSVYNQRKLGPINYFERYTSNVYDPSDSACWWKMTPPVESSTQSPLNPQSKPTNTDKMPDRGQVESRLNQIRDYIKVTSSMMESLSQSNDPRAQHQREKLSRMVEDLYDSEQKLSKLLEDQHKLWNENGEPEILVDVAVRKQQIEESERKLAELQEQQQQLDDMQNRMKERLDAAREAQRVLLLEDEGINLDNGQAGEEEIIQEAEIPKSVQLERDAEALRNKLGQLKTKKSHVDHLVAEIQAFEALEQASCKSENSQGTPRDKRAELELMKNQLSHLKALMDNAIGVTADSYHEREEIAIYQAETDNSPGAINEIEPALPSSRNGQPNIEEIQAVTRELKEQSALLQVARAELQRLKQGQSGHQNPSPSFTSNSPPPNLMCNLQNGLPEKKQANNAFSQIQNFTAQCNPMQIMENKFRKDSSQVSSVHHNSVPEWESRRGSTSRNSQASTPGNLWPSPSIINGQREINIDGVADNELELGSQIDSNCWGTSSLPMNQTNGLQANGVVGTAEYYRQLLMGSQSQQLQMMCTTIQQCCQLLWAQQREIQSLRNAMNQLTLQLRDSRPPEAEGHSNLTRPIHRTNGDVAEASTLPPSSSLPNLVTLPNVPPVPTRSEQTQLNNQVPPGNRANNYWDNFRSYSRQNLLSGNSKTHSEHTAGSVASSSSVKEKSNRENCPERHLLNLIGETEEASYSQNLNLNNDVQQQEVALQSTDAENSNEISCAKIAEDISKRDDLRLILMHCLQILTAKKSNSPAPSNVISNTSYTSDDESEAGARAINPINFSSSPHNFTTNDSIAGASSMLTNNQNLDFPHIDDQIDLVQNELLFENLADEIILDQFGESIPSRLDCSNNNQVSSTEGLPSNVNFQMDLNEPVMILHVDSNAENLGSHSTCSSCYNNDSALDFVVQGNETSISQNLSPNQTLDSYQSRLNESQNGTMYSF